MDLGVNCVWLVESWRSMGVYGDVKLAKPNANIQEAMQELL